VPQFLLEGGLAKSADQKRLCIACTQPRRVAAMTVARRVADEMGSELVRESSGACVGKWNPGRGLSGDARAKWVILWSSAGAIGGVRGALRRLQQ
jgi:hypothetical protein